MPHGWTHNHVMPPKKHITSWANKLYHCRGFWLFWNPKISSQTWHQSLTLPDVSQYFLIQSSSFTMIPHPMLLNRPSMLSLAINLCCEQWINTKVCVCGSSCWQLKTTLYELPELVIGWDTICNAEKSSMMKIPSISCTTSNIIHPGQALRHWKLTGLVFVGMCRILGASKG